MFNTTFNIAMEMADGLQSRISQLEKGKVKIVDQGTGQITGETTGMSERDAAIIVGE